jgi:hypothetical protein
MYTNIDSLINKKDELVCRVHELDPDIIGVTEILPKSTRQEILEQDLYIDGYQLFCNNTGRGRGIAL